MGKGKEITGSAIVTKGEFEGQHVVVLSNKFGLATVRFGSAELEISSSDLRSATKKDLKNSFLKIVDAKKKSLKILEESTPRFTPAY